MPKMFIKVEDVKEGRTYFFEWSTISDEPNSDAVEGEKDFETLHWTLKANLCKNKAEWKKLFKEDLANLNEGNVSNPDYTRKELLDCSDEYKTLKSLVAYAKANLIQY